MAGVPVSEPGVNLTALRLSAREIQVLGLVDGTASTEDIAAACGLAAVEADAIFHSLQQQGVIRVNEPPRRVVVGRMGMQRISMGAALQAESLDDVGSLLGRARAALTAGDLAAARELCNLAWMADPGSPEVARLKAETEPPAKPAPTPAPVTPAAPALAIPDPSVSKNPKARALVLQAVKKAAAGDYAGAFRDVQMASVMEAGNPEITRFKADLERLKKA